MLSWLFGSSPVPPYNPPASWEKEVEKEKVDTTHSNWQEDSDEKLVRDIWRDLGHEIGKKGRYHPIHTGSLVRYLDSKSAVVDPGAREHKKDATSAAGAATDNNNRAATSVDPGKKRMKFTNPSRYRSMENVSLPP